MEEIKDKEEEIKPKKKKSFIKRFFKFLMYIVVSLIALNVLLYALLSIPFIQQKVVNFAVNKLKVKLQTEVSIDEVRLRLFNHAMLKGIYIEDQSKDTLLYAQMVDVSLNPWKLLRSSTLEITGIRLDDFVINVNQKDSISDFNFQFVIDAFASSDTTKIDTTKSALTVVINDIDIKNGRLNYDVLSVPATPHLFNPSHISLYDFNGNIDLYSIDPDKLDIALNELSAKEKSGLEITELKGHLYSEKSQLWIDDISLKLPNSHLTTSSVRYDLSTQAFEIATQDTEIAPEDLISVMPSLKYLTHNISLKTSVKGTLPLVNLESIILNYGEDCIIEGHGYISNYQKYGDADIELSIDKFKITPTDITSFAKVGDSTFIAPDILKTIGDINLKAKLSGQLSKFNLTAEAWSKLGAINMVTRGAIDTTFNNFNIETDLRTQNFNLAKIAGAKSGIGRLSMSINLRARQSAKQSLTAQARGRINSLSYHKGTLKDIPFEAHYNAAAMGVSLDANLSVGRVIAAIDMTQAKVPDITLNLKVEDLQVDRFYDNEAWENPRLSFIMDGKIKGLDIDNMTGKVIIDSLTFLDANFIFKPKAFVLESGRNSENEKFISLTSAFFSANIAGKYKFTALSDEFTNLMHSYLPSVFVTKKRIKNQQNDFTFTISAENTEELTPIFTLPATIITPVKISGHINTIAQKIDIQGSIPYVKYNDIDIKNTNINIVNRDSAFSVKVGSDVMMENNTYNLSLKIDGADDGLHSLLDLNNDSININGKIESLIRFSRSYKKELISELNIIPSDINIKNFKLNMLPAKIKNMGERTEIENFGIAFNKKKYFGANGVVSREKTDSLKVYFDNAQIGDLLEAFEVKNIRASINGDILLKNVLQQPELYTKGFSISDIMIQNDTIGTINIESLWNEELGGVKLNASLKQKQETRAEIKGVIYTNRDALDLKVHVDRLPLNSMQFFVNNMLNNLSGSVSTELTVQGTTKKPAVEGFLGFNDAHLGIDYTNVIYDISDTIKISPDKIGFDNLIIKDPGGNTARVNAIVTHKNFQDMKYSLNMQMNKFMVLNTESRTDSLFYGRVFASGNVRIDGDDKGINVNMQIKNEKNSVLNVLLPQSAEANDYKSVVFINVPEDKLEQNALNNISTFRRISDALPLKLNIRLEVTPDIELGVIINQATGDAMQVKGNGVINFTYDMQTLDMRTLGNYVLTDGSVRLNLQNISRLEFKIKEGSRINFIGDPLKTTFDITAVRRVRSDLTTLDESFGGEGVTTRVNVDCILGISGNKDKITLTYNISLPDASDDIQRKVSSIINTDQLKLTQFAYLVMSGRFYSNNSNANGSLGGGIWTNLASSTLSSGLDAAFGNILGDKWQIGTNIESNNGTLSDVDMTVNVSTKLFNDKLKLNTNVGYRTENSGASDNAFIGDLDIEYKLNNLWTLRAYNQTNDRFYRQAPTTQGIGIVYTREASSLKRLFQSLRRRARFTLTEPLPTDTTKTTKTTNAMDSISTIVIEKKPTATEEQK